MPALTVPADSLAILPRVDSIIVLCSSPEIVVLSGVVAPSGKEKKRRSIAASAVVRALVIQKLSPTE